MSSISFVELSRQPTSSKVMSPCNISTSFSTTSKFKLEYIAPPKIFAQTREKHKTKQMVASLKGMEDL